MEGLEDQAQDKYYLDSENDLERLRKQHEWIEFCLKGKLVFAPIDLQKEDMMILDVGCADGDHLGPRNSFSRDQLTCYLGILLRDLKKQLPTSATFVGVDLTPFFLPKNEHSSIRFLHHNISQPFPPGLQSTF